MFVFCQTTHNGEHWQSSALTRAHTHTHTHTLDISIPFLTEGSCKQANVIFGEPEMTVESRYVYSMENQWKTVYIVRRRPSDADCVRLGLYKDGEERGLL